MNNSGYGLSGSLEKSSPTGKRVTTTNVKMYSGSLNVIRRVILHTCGSNRLDISSTSLPSEDSRGSFRGIGDLLRDEVALISDFPKSLAEEAKAFGIHVIVVEPGYFRTSFLSVLAPCVVPVNPLKVYEAVRAIAGASSAFYQW